MKSINRSNLLYVVLGAVSVTAILPELDIPFFKIDLFNLVAPACGVVLILYNSGKIKESLTKYKSEIIIVALFFASLLISTLVSIDIKIAGKQYIKYLEVIIFMSGLLLHINSEDDVRIVFKFNLYFIVMLACIGIFLYIDPYLFKNIFFAHRKARAMLPRNESLLSNPNIYGVYSAIMLSLLLIMKEKLKISKITFIIILMFVIFGLLASGSFNGLLTAAFILLLYLIVIKKRYKAVLCSGLLIIIIFSTFLLIYNFKIKGTEGVTNRYFQRMAVSSSRSLNFRLIMWNSAVKSIAGHPIFGSGPFVFNQYHYEYSTMPERYKSKYKNHLNAHNIFLQILVESGFMGFAFFSSIFVLLYHLIKKKKYYAAFPLLAFFAGCIPDCFLWDYFMNIILVSLLAIAVYANRSGAPAGAAAEVT